MSTIRKDYLLERYVYFATKRGKRPHEFKKPLTFSFPKLDIFGPGNEKMIPDELGHVAQKGTWSMRWIPNKFPVVELTGKPGFTGSKLFKESKGYGAHELIIETRSQKTKLGDLSVQEIALLFKVYAERIDHHLQKPGVKYVQVFKNHGPNAGASIIHEHSQIIAMPQIPPSVQLKLDALSSHSGDVMKHILKTESTSRRKIKKTKHFVSFCPFASRFNYEAWIYPLEEIPHFEDLDYLMRKELAEHLKLILTKLQLMDASYNFTLHYAPKGEDMRIHIEITPRIATWAGFELGTDCIVNSVLPEDAAAYYRST